VAYAYWYVGDRRAHGRGACSMVVYMNPNGMTKLVLAICQQWVSDGKPASSRESIERYAGALREAQTLHRRAWYNQARRNVRVHNEDKDWYQL